MKRPIKNHCKVDQNATKPKQAKGGKLIHLPDTHSIDHTHTSIQYPPGYTVKQKEVLFLSFPAMGISGFLCVFFLVLVDDFEFQIAQKKKRNAISFSYFRKRIFD